MEDKWQNFKKQVLGIRDNLKQKFNEHKPTIEPKPLSYYSTIPINYFKTQQWFYDRTDKERGEVSILKRILYFCCASLIIKGGITITKHCKSLVFVAVNAGLLMYYFPELKGPILNFLNEKPKNP